MQILDFTDFARRRSVPLDTMAQAAAAPLAPNTDRWAALHTDSPRVDDSKTANIVAFDAADIGFFDDLQLRFAYPTLHLRHS